MSSGTLFGQRIGGAFIGLRCFILRAQPGLHRLTVAARRYIDLEDRCELLQFLETRINKLFAICRLQRNSWLEIRQKVEHGILNFVSLVALKQITELVRKYGEIPESFFLHTLVLQVVPGECREWTR